MGNYSCRSKRLPCWHQCDCARKQWQTSVACSKVNTEQAHDGIQHRFNFFFCFFHPSYSICLLPLFPPLFCCLLFLSLSCADISEMQVLLHETPAVALIEGRYGGTKPTGGRACPLSLLLSTGLTFGNCKLQNLQGQNVWHYLIWSHMVQTGRGSKQKQWKQEI